MELNSSLAVISDALGEIDTGVTTLFSEILDGLDIPGCVHRYFAPLQLVLLASIRVISVLPSIDVSTRTTASFETAVDFNATVGYAIENTRYSFSFPQMVGKNSTPTDAALTGTCM